MVSFLDRLMDCITLKIRKQINLTKGLRMACDGSTSVKSYLEEQVQAAKEILVKYESSFFLKELMTEKSASEKVGEALG